MKDYEIKLPKLLNKYDLSDFEIKLKVKFIFSICVAMNIIIIPIILYSAYIQIITDLNNSVDLIIIGMESAISLSFLFCLFILIKGYYRIAAHLLIILSLICLWLILFFNESDPFIRLDSIVFSLAILSMIPIFFSKKKHLILYFSSNIFIFSIFAIFIYFKNIIPNPSLLDYYLDTLIAIIFLGVVSYNIIRINKLMMRKLELELKERQYSQDALLKSERKFKNLADLLPQVIFETDIFGNLTYVNNKGFELFQYTISDFERGINFLTIIHPNDIETAKNNFQNTLNGQINLENEYKCKKKNGEILVCKIYTNRKIDNNTVSGLSGILIDITESKKIEEDLVRKEQFSNRIFSSSRVPIVIINKDDLKIVECNLSAVMIYGYEDKAELIGKTPLDFSADYQYDGSPSVIKAKILVEEAVKNGSIVFEWQNQRKDGSFWDTEVHLLSYHSDNENLLQYSVIDITDRKQKEKILVESEQRARKQRYAISHIALDSNSTMDNPEMWYKLVVTTTLDAIDSHRISIWYLDKSDSCLVCKILFDKNSGSFSSGYSLSCSEFPAYFQALYKESRIYAEDVYSDERTSELAENYFKPLGICSLLDSAIQISGKIIGVICVEHIGVKRRWTADEESFISTISALISQSIINNENLKKNDELRKLYTGIEQSPISILITDMNGIIEYVNPKYIETSGYSYNDLIGTNSTFLIIEDQPNNNYNDMINAITEGKSWTGELKRIRKNGDIIWTNTLITPIYNEYQKITNYISIQEDITEKKRILEELIIAKDKAEESDRLKTAFLQNMSHEIRTPLNGIIGFSKFLESQSVLQEEIHEFVDLIKLSSNRLIETINNILELSKIETGQIQINYSLISLNTLLSDLYEYYIEKAMSKSLNLNLFTSCDNDNCFVLGDYSKLSQILSGLIDNAIKFTFEGSIEFGYEFENDLIVFRVSDTGIGIPEEHREKIFQKFYQADLSISRGFEGSGLGLSICSELVRILNGQLWCESIFVKGSTFIFSIPRLSQKHDYF